MATQKQYRIWMVLALTVLAVGLLIPGNGGVDPVQAQVATDQPRTVTVAGVGRAFAEPDTAVFVVGVETQADSASAALNENSEQMQSLIAALRSAGIAEADIQTQTVQLQPRYTQPPDQPVEPSTEPAIQVAGYIAINTVQVRVRELDNLGELLDAAVEAGGNTIQNISFEFSDTTDLLDQARQQAFADAQQKAGQLADLANAELGEVFAINEFSVSPRPLFDVAFAQAEQAAVPIQPGSQAVELNLNVTWYLE